MVIVIVVVVAVVVLVATGRGGELSVERNDYLELDLGPVSATDVALLRPPMALWGYNMQATDEAMDRIAASIRDRDVRIVALEQLVTDLSQGAGRAAAQQPVRGRRGTVGRRSTPRRRRRSSRMTDAPSRAPAAPAAAMAATAAGEGAVAGPDGRLRCPWGLSAPDYVAYHDIEWGRPVRGDQAIFERLCLEAFQSGLSWLTILRKRENFRKAFAGFDIEAVAAFADDDVARLLADAGIVRNRAKINAAITNARAALELKEGLSDLFWGYADAASAPGAAHRWPTSRRRRPRPRRWPRSCASAASSSPARSPSTPPCRPAAWSTTTWRRVSPVRTTILIHNQYTPRNRARACNNTPHGPGRTRHRRAVRAAAAGAGLRRRAQRGTARCSPTCASRSTPSCGART